MIFTLAKPWKINLRNLAKLCETMRNYKLRNLVKYCETLQNHIRESVRKLAKSYLRKLAKPKHFCESMFAKLAAKACKNTCISHSRNLAKTWFAKTYLRNLAKGVFIASFPGLPLPFPWLRQGPPQPRLLSMVILNVFRLFIITFPKSIVSAVLLSFVCPKCFIMYANQPMTKSVTQLCNLPDLSCSQILFRFKPLSRQHQHHWSSCLWMFSPFLQPWQRADGRRHHWPWKETLETAFWLSRSRSWSLGSRCRDWTCQFSKFTIDLQFYRVDSVKCKTHR